MSVQSAFRRLAAVCGSRYRHKRATRVLRPSDESALRMAANEAEQAAVEAEKIAEEAKVNSGVGL
jgi:hypothetical protein